MVIRKRFGQHFLHDPAVIRRIIDAVAPARGERVVELGPGRGALTFGLLERAQRLDAIEIDRDLARLLEADPRAQGRLHLHVENMLDTDFDASAGAGTEAADRRQPPLQRLDARAVSSSEPARRDRGHAFHAAEGSRRSHGGRARRQGVRAAHRHARRLRRGRGAVRGRARRFPSAAESALRDRALASEHRAAIRDRQRCRAAHARAGRLLPSPQDPAQRPEGPLERRGHRGLRDRSATAPGNAHAGAIRPPCRHVRAQRAADAPARDASKKRGAREG